MQVASSHHIKEFIETAEGNFFLVTGSLDIEVGFVGEGVFFSNGNLSVWEQRNEGLPSSSIYAETIAVDRNGRLYLGVADTYTTGAAGLFISDNDGLHWQHVPLEVSDLGALRVERLLTINITPDDSVIVSSQGAVANFGYRLNIVKHRDEVAQSSPWRPLRVWNTNMWWMDQLLNRIYYSSKGNWYSSISGGISQGGTWMSDNRGVTWKQIARGLPLAITNRYEAQHFYETSLNQLLMIQLFDERMYVLAGTIGDFYTVSGQVRDITGKGINEVVVYGLEGAVFTDQQGKFALDVRAGSSGHLSFVKDKYEFVPDRIVIDDLHEDTTNIQVIALQQGLHLVFGNISTASGEPISNIRIDGLGDSVLTDLNGNFAYQLPPGWSGIIKPVSEEYEFLPAQLEINNLQYDSVSLNFMTSMVTEAEELAVPVVTVFPNPSFDGKFKLSISRSEPVVVSLLLRTAQ